MATYRFDENPEPMTFRDARGDPGRSVEAVKPPYGSGDYRNFAYECREVFISLSHCRLSAGHNGPHQTH